MNLFILKTDVEKFTSTYKKTLHLIFNAGPGASDTVPTSLHELLITSTFKHYLKDVLFTHV